MGIWVRYQNTRHEIHVDIDPAKSTVQIIMNRIRDQLGIDVSKQKLIFKGQCLRNKKAKLSDLKIANGSKLLLIMQEDPQRRPKESGTTKPVRKVSAYTSQREAPKGPPKGSLKGEKTPANRFPKEPLVVYRDDGIVTRLSFETDALWTESDSGDKERIFLDQIKNPKVECINGYDDYLQLSFEVGTVEPSRTVRFDFIPNQFRQVLIEYLKPNQ